MLEHSVNIEQTKPQSSLQSYLDIQSHWRNQGIPTLTVLSGSFNDTQKLWCQWIQGEGRDTAIWSPSMPKSLSISWLDKLLAAPKLRHQLLSYLAAVNECSIEQIHFTLLSKSNYELEIFQQQLSVEISSQGSLLLSWFLKQISISRKLTSSLVSDLALIMKLEDDQNLAQGIMAFAELLSTDILPGLLIEITDDELLLSPLIRTLVQIAESLPSIPIALSITPTNFENHCKKAPESRIKAMLRHGMIEVHPDKSLHCTLPEEVDRVLRQYDAPAQMIDEAKSLFQLIKEKGNDYSLARSQAELFLFHVLELVPETRGVFQLNARMPFPFGNRPMEIDLFAISDQIALEIDGYYHFQEPESWRRDRRKDFILQMHGILVLRFLAEDVVSMLEGILDSVHQALQYRRGKSN
ncbi:uncharacterized protein DUF559 [Nitrosomonas nitrosa]|uniref:DUF559 domain-containing protein n=1 Tax=Nitrosomonas nitrosa TaxID=52442 RepID=A0A1I4TM91_9PROT|nr:DUF559 domain-containing protein [Nitrosomonas nitrosa]PTQ92595.1 uncharacterized protein DUF559 [Nitrosomonas nitrosa]SFM77741.1 Protein of unknown function [Nitrosomonas nitrosa]